MEGSLTLLSLWVFCSIKILRVTLVERLLGVTSKNNNSIFVDIVHIGGREVNPMSKNLSDNLGLSCAKLSALLSSNLLASQYLAS